jgi:hypothetical protein
MKKYLAFLFLVTVFNPLHLYCSVHSLHAESSGRDLHFTMQRSSQMEARLREIREIARGRLTTGQKKALRAEVLYMKQQSADVGIYLSGAALLVIIILLIVLL